MHGSAKATQFVRRLFVFWPLLVFSVALSLTQSFAQEYPNRPIHIISNSSPGALVDLFARVYAQKLQERTGQPVVVENRTAATGVVGAEFVARSKPDGYTLLVSGHNALVILPQLNPNSRYTSKDFTPISLFGTTPSMLLVNDNLPVKSLADLIALAKAKPRMITYGSQGFASSGHMATAQLILETGIDMVNVPYRGSGPALTALVAKQVDILFETVRAESLAFVRAGQVRALAIASEKRVPELPNVPTTSEAGVPNLESGFWVALLAPAKTPPDIIKFLNKQAIEIFNEPEVSKRIAEQAVTLQVGSPQDLAHLMDAETTRWGNVIRRTGMKFPD
jgi:tripartite-type tricarboxylate transporter receptor subunit TctC